MSGIKLNKGTSVGIIGGDCERSVLEGVVSLGHLPALSGVSMLRTLHGVVDLSSLVLLWILNVQRTQWQHYGYQHSFSGAFNFKS